MINKTIDSFGFLPCIRTGEQRFAVRMLSFSIEQIENFLTCNTSKKFLASSVSSYLWLTTDAGEITFNDVAAILGLEEWQARLAVLDYLEAKLGDQFLRFQEAIFAASEQEHFEAKQEARAKSFSGNQLK